MKKNFIGIFMIVLMVCTACASTKKATSKPDITYVLMRRTACFGHCPNYAIEIYKDGLVRFSGYNFVADTGVYEKNIGAQKAQKLLKEISSYNVDTLKKSYKVLISDLPGLYYRFKYNNAFHEVLNAHYGPNFLKSLANEIDELVKKNDLIELDNTWKKISYSGKGD